MERERVLYLYTMEGPNKTCALYLQFYTDCIEHKERLDIQKAVSNLSIPQLIIHGDSDPTVLVKEAKDLHKWNPKSELFILKRYKSCIWKLLIHIIPKNYLQIYSL